MPESEFRFELADERATAAFARRVCGAVTGGMTIGLAGELGVGKTTFVKYLAAEAGVAEGAVSSPSFVLEQEYAGSRLLLDHWDLYRLGEAPLDLLDPPEQNVLRLIEWPDKSPDVLGTLDLLIRFEFGETEARSAIISGPAAVRCLG